jgi:dipeptidyl aminopeptidase/acylaminoacyl peptidase
MPQPIGPELVYELTAVADPTLSPDGTRVAFARSKIDKESMATRSQIMMAALPDGESDPFTGGQSDAGPRFSPDGKRIAFTRDDTKGRRQLWVIGTSGGEATQLTSPRRWGHGARLGAQLAGAGVRVGRGPRPALRRSRRQA